MFGYKYYDNIYVDNFQLKNGGLVIKSTNQNIIRYLY